MVNPSDSINAQLKAVADKYAPLKAEINSTAQFINEELAKAEAQVDANRANLARAKLAYIEVAAAEKMAMVEILGKAGFVVFQGGQS